MARFHPGLDGHDGEHAEDQRQQQQARAAHRQPARALWRWYTPRFDEPAYTDRFLVKMLGREFFVPAMDIEYVQAAGNYVNLVVGGREYPLRMPCLMAVSTDESVVSETTFPGA